MTAPQPDDIMLLIFDRLICADGAEAAWPDMMYDQRAARAPFVVAAVCRRWRGLALATSTLWTYFGFPRAGSVDKRDLQRLELLRCRVGNAPTDVVFGWDHRHEAEGCTEGVALLVFNAVMSLHLQWKTVVLHIMGGTKYGWTMDEALQSSQWPLLESLSLAIDITHDAIPGAPLLRRIWLDCHHTSVEGPFIVGGCPALAVLSLYGDSVPILRGLALAFENQLIDLALIDDCDDFVDAMRLESTRTVFPALQSLTLDDVLWLRHIDTPVPKKLILTHRHVDKVEKEVLCRFDHVQDLQLCGEFEINELAALKDLSNITTLTFDCPPTLIAAFKNRRNLRRIDSGALYKLASLEPPVWPHLKRLHFGAKSWQTWTDLYCRTMNAFVSYRSRNEDAAQDVVDFVSARALRATSPDGPAIARIVEIVVKHPGAPEWLEGRLRELIAD